MKINSGFVNFPQALKAVLPLVGAIIRIFILVDFFNLYNLPPMFITRHGHKIDVEQIKSAHLSSGYIVYWFRALKPVFKGNEFIVAVHNPQGNTEHYINLPSAQSASSYYLNWLCIYA